MELATITIERRHTDQRGHLLAIEASQFGQVHQQAGDGHRAYAGHRLQQGGLATKLWLIFHQLADGFFQLTDLFVELFDQVTHIFANDLRERRLQTVLLGRSQLDQLSAAGHQLAQFGLFFRGDFHRPWVGLLTKAGNHPRVEPIGLGQDPQAAGEVADLAGIDHGHTMTGRHQSANQRC